MLSRFQKCVWGFKREFSNKVGILGVPFDKGQSKEGVHNGPAAIRKAGLVEILSNIHENMDVKDFGDAEYSIDKMKTECEPPNMKQWAHTAACTQEVSQQVANIMNEDRMCVTLGGDHSIAIGTIEGHLKARGPDVCIFWIDAHADLNTNQTSGSGNIHGMPLAILVKELMPYWPYLPGMNWQTPTLSIRNVAYIGLRSVDAYERLVIEKFGITAYGIEDVEDYGVGSVVRMALDRLDPERKRSIHISFDIDALDTLEAPSTGTSVRGGLTLREGIHIVEKIQRTGRLKSFDLVEVNPAIGSKKDVDKTVDAAIHLIQAACGYQRRGLRPYKTNLPLPTLPTKPS